MIPSYQEEIRIRKNKDRIFWLTVFVITIFLYFFFQGYYPNYERFLHRENISKQAFLKPFGIIDIRVFPSPDEILVNGKPYSNNSKTIFDLGRYMVSIKKEGYLPVVFPLDITKENPFYTNVVNLFALPKYSATPFIFSDFTLYDDLLLLRTMGSGSFILSDTEFQTLHYIQTEYMHIGGSYFTDGSSVLSYSLETKKFLNVVDSKTKLPAQCRRVSYYGKMLFCHDTMRFVGPKTPDIREEIIAINNRVIVTPEYVYNQDGTNQDWKYFEYQTGAVKHPDAVVRINKIPYFFEDGKIFPVDGMPLSKVSPKKSDW